MDRHILMLVACLSALAFGTAKARAADVPVDPPAGAVQAALDQATGAVTPPAAEGARTAVPDAADAVAQVAGSSTTTDNENPTEGDAPPPPPQDEDEAAAGTPPAESATEPTSPEHGDEPAPETPPAESPPPPSGTEPPPGGPAAGSGDNPAEASGENASESSAGTQVQQGAGQNAPSAPAPVTVPTAEPPVTTPPPETTPPTETTPPPAAVSPTAEPGGATPPPAPGSSEPAETPVSIPPAGPQQTGSRSCGRTTRPAAPPRHRETAGRLRPRHSLDRGTDSRLAVARPAGSRAIPVPPTVRTQQAHPAAKIRSAAAPAEPKANARSQRPAPSLPHPRLRVDEAGSRAAQPPSDNSSATSRESWLLLLAILLGLLGMTGLAYAGLPGRRDMALVSQLSLRLRSKGLSESRVAWHAPRRLRSTKGGNHDAIRYRE